MPGRRRTKTQNIEQGKGRRCQNGTCNHFRTGSYCLYVARAQAKKQAEKPKTAANPYAAYRSFERTFLRGGSSGCLDRRFPEDSYGCLDRRSGDWE